MPSPVTESNQLNLGAYSAPSLKVYGSVMVLTASGTGTDAENGNQPNCSTAPARRPC